MDYSGFLDNIAKKQGKKAKKYLILSIVVFALALTFFVVSCFFINDKTIIYLSIINIAILFTASSFAFYAVFGIVIPLTKQNKIFKKIFEAPETNVEGEVVRIKKNVTLDDGVVGDEVIVLINEQEIALTLFAVFGIELSEKKNYIFTTRSNYLLGAENEK